MKKKDTTPEPRQEEKKDGMNRRDFFKKTGAAGLGVLGASLFSPFGKPFLYAGNKPINFAFCEVQSGLFGTLGSGAMQAAKIAEKHINDQGGIMGRPFKCFYEDTQAKPSEGTRVAKKLIFEENVIGIHGSSSTSVTKALCEVAGQYGKLHLNSDMDGTATYPAMHELAFRLGPADGPTLMRSLVYVANQKHPDFKKWAVLTPDYAWGHDCLADFKEAIANTPALKDGEILEVLHPFGCSDFSSQIQKILDFKPDGIVTISWAGDMVTFLRQQQPYKLYEKSVGFHYGLPVGIAKAMGEQMVPVWAPMSAGNPSIASGRKFNKMFKKETGHWVPIDTCAQVYDGLFILKKAIEKAKSDDPKEVAAQLEGMEYDGYAGWIKIRPESHLALKKVHYVGKLGPVEGAPYWLGKDIIEIPYEKVMVTDKEAKEKWGLQMPL